MAVYKVGYFIRKIELLILMQVKLKLISISSVNVLEIFGPLIFDIRVVVVSKFDDKHEYLIDAVDQQR